MTLLALPNQNEVNILKDRGIERALQPLVYSEVVLPCVKSHGAMALLQGKRQEEQIHLLHDIKIHWKQPKVVLTRLQTWTTQQPIAVEALVATLAGSAQVAARTIMSQRYRFVRAK